MSGVFPNIDPPAPHCPASVYPPAIGAGGGHTRWAERGWGSIVWVWKTPDTALYYIYVSTLYKALPLAYAAGVNICSMSSPQKDIHRG